MLTKHTQVSNNLPVEPVALENLSVKFMNQACFVPLNLENNTLTVLMSNPDDFQTIDALKAIYGKQIVAHQAREADILGTVERLYGAGRHSLETIIAEAGRTFDDAPSETELDTEHLRDMASEAPIVRLVNRLILDAVALAASDIHFEPYEDEFKIRYRIDGVLADVESPPKRFQAAIISRVKIMAKLDIAERRLPQDGRIKLKIDEREINFRVSTVPTLCGESLVMRILDRQTLLLDLQTLGIPRTIREQYLATVNQPYGMLLVTGPTGSGKTTTLYATLSLLNAAENKIITLEDPVEYQLAGINQIQVNPKIGLTFAAGLRAIVRQDPDIILVGEIRDRETADTAVHSALTGHMLFSTIHTNDAAGAIARLLDMGVEDFLLCSSLLGILAQRLVRVICPECKTQVRPSRDLLNAMGIDFRQAADVRVFQGRGCENCRFSGFKGRTGIFEYLPLSDGLRKAIIDHQSREQLKQYAMEEGFVSLRKDGWDKVKQGITTVAEVLRVTSEE